MRAHEIGYGVDAVLKPESIAIIGVSGNPEKALVTGGTAVMGNLLRYGFEGNIYPVNPHHAEIMGYPCYPSIRDVPKPVDLAVIAIRADLVPACLKECALAGCRAAVIVSSGFSETRTTTGTELEQELRNISLESGIRVLGPNNLGCYNVRDHIFPSSSTAIFYYENIKPGGIAWVSQSGAIASTLQGRAADRNIGLSYVVTSGNECDLETGDFVWYLASDPRVKVIGLYVEGIRDREKFAKAAQRARLMGKPVLVYKAGVSESGAKAVLAHTGSVAGDMDDYCDFFRQNGVLVLDTLDELYQTAHLLEQWIAFPETDSAGIVAISGGEGAAIADGLSLLDFSIPPVAPDLYTKLMDIIPSFGSGQNPVDVTAHLMRTPEKITEVGKLLEKQGDIDMILYSLTTVAKGRDLRVANDIRSAVKQSQKPCAVCWFSSDVNAEAVACLRNHDIPVFTDNTSLFMALSHRRQYFHLNRLRREAVA